MFKILIENGLTQEDWGEAISILKRNIVHGNTLEKSIEEIFSEHHS
jgi:hypothetical protein